jgi:hypothetical protein
MGYVDLRDWLRRQPFQPFRIHLTDGSSFNVWRQEGYLLTTRYMVVGMPGETGGTDYDRTSIVDLLHIVRLEPLELPIPPQGNGQAG